MEMSMLVRLIVLLVGMLLTCAAPYLLFLVSVQYFAFLAIPGSILVLGVAASLVPSYLKGRRDVRAGREV